MAHRAHATTAPAPPGRLDLPVEGMSCASCAARVERSLNGLEGVDASVNYATGTASVAFDPALADPARLVEAVERAGYRVRPPEEAADAAGEEDERGPGRRLAVSALLSLPVLLVSMIPALRFEGWEWIALALAAPVVLWGGWPFHRAAWAGLRRRAASMDTLISLGTLAALGWSAVVVLSGADADVYLEVAAVVTTFLLAGRWLEARAKRRAGAALAGLLELGAKEASLLDEDGSERRVPAAALQVGDRILVRPGERIAADGVVEAGASTVDCLAADRRERPRRGRAGRRGGRRGDQRRRAPGGARNARRRRHGPGADRPPGDRGAVGEGPRPAPRRPRLCGLRARRDRPGRRHPCGLARGRRRRRRGVHRRGRRADRRLPLRPGAGHAGRAAGRHRPRGPARDPDPRARSAGVNAPRRHRPAGQDGHGDRRRDGPRRGRGGRRSRRRRGAAPRRRAGGGLGAPDREGDRRGRPGRGRGPAGPGGLRQPRGPRRRGGGRGPQRRRGPAGAARGPGAGAGR